MRIKTWVFLVDWIVSKKWDNSVVIGLEGVYFLIWSPDK